MKAKRYEIAGQKFARLLAVERSGSLWLCKCDCGETRQVAAYDLIRGRYKSCGCKHREDIASGMQYRHGMSHTKEHRAWCKLRERCLNPKDPVFRLYGGRGISVCDRWRDSFENFYADMGQCPSSLHSIDRIENAGNYEPGNCRWATKQEQAINRDRTRWHTYQGETLCQKDWAAKLGITHGAIGYWLKKGWTFDRIAEHFQPKAIAA